MTPNGLQTLGPGGVHDLSSAPPLPEDVPLGAYKLLFVVDADDIVIEANETDNVRAVDVWLDDPGVDLTPSFVRWTLTMGSQGDEDGVFRGDVVKVTGVVLNHGEVDVLQPVTVRVDLVGPTTFSGVAEVASATTSGRPEWAAFISLPNDAPPGAYQVFVEVDPLGEFEDYYEENDRKRASRDVPVVLRPIPNFVPVAASPTPLSPAQPRGDVAFEDGVVAVTVANVGGADGQPFTVRVDLFEQGRGGPVGEIVVLVPSEESLTVDVPVTWPDSAWPGDEFILQVAVDPDDEIAEIDETDNFLPLVWSLGPPARPELTLTDLVVSGPVRAEETADIGVMVHNLGTVPSGPFLLRAGLSQVGDSLAVSLWNHLVALDAGESQLVLADEAESMPVPLDAWMNGAYEVVVEADGLQEVAEARETNNRLTEEITVAAPAWPDLTITGIDVPSSVPQDLDVAVTVTVENLGLSPSVPTAVTLRAFRTFFGNVDVGIATVPGIDAGASAQIDTTIRVPSGGPWLGSMSLVGVVDLDEVVHESDEGNNVFSEPIEVVVP